MELLGLSSACSPFDSSLAKSIACYFSVYRGKRTASFTSSECVCLCLSDEEIGAGMSSTAPVYLRSLRSLASALNSLQRSSALGDPSNCSPKSRFASQKTFLLSNTASISKSTAAFSFDLSMAQIVDS